MKRLASLLIVMMSFSCSDIPTDQNKENSTLEWDELELIRTDEYDLYLPKGKSQALLILFGGYPETASDVQREFPILEHAKNHDVAVLFSNFNRKLWLAESEKQLLARDLQTVIEEHKLPSDKVFIGGYSSGGVVSLHLSNYVNGLKEFYFDPKGVFIIDSPIDLQALYKSSQKNLKRNFSEVSVQESTWIIQTLESTFGIPEEHLAEYEKNAIYTHSAGYTYNLNKLKDTRLRLYTEPDTIWWKENRMADYDQMNAFYIKELSLQLQSEGFTKVELIETENKGYRANGDRHPHSWSIVDKEDLFSWILAD